MPLACSVVADQKENLFPKHLTIERKYKPYLHGELNIKQ